jgi:hypothetical protein
MRAIDPVIPIMTEFAGEQGAGAAPLICGLFPARLL